MNGSTGRARWEAQVCQQVCLRAAPLCVTQQRPSLRAAAEGAGTHLRKYPGGIYKVDLKQERKGQTDRDACRRRVRSR